MKLVPFRDCAPTLPTPKHHVMNRGIARRPIFEIGTDRRSDSRLRCASASPAHPANASVHDPLPCNRLPVSVALRDRDG